VKRVVLAFAALLLLLALGAAVTAYFVTRHGLSARAEPTRLEVLVARTVRRLATPRDMRSRANPLEATEAVRNEGLEHFADHCASCHANDGSGNTSIGRSMYPPAPDMRAAATQSLSDGELFSIIENGIRLTGMPAWSTGTTEGERDSWALVHFIRGLPALSAADIERMEALNPRTPAEFREEEAARRFLAGEDEAADTTGAAGGVEAGGGAAGHRH
jgi:mono/diheme cytochrome c family protein